jgi:ribosomal protein L7Ae-like RNA K-turn-binding protein
LTNVASIPCNTGDGLLLDVASDADHANAVQVLEIIAKIELVEVQRDAELGIAGGKERCSDEGDDEFRSVDRITLVLGLFARE